MKTGTFTLTLLALLGLFLASPSAFAADEYTVVIKKVEVKTTKVVLVRPWRFFWARRRCPRCQGLLPGWNVWGWREDWARVRCGCLINR